MAREIVPGGPFGTALYDVLQTKRKPNRHAWGAKELAAALEKGGVRISAKQIREWIKGHPLPTIDYVIAIAEVLEVDCGQLWNRAAKPINLPQNGRSTRPRGGAAGLAADPSLTAAQATKAAAAAQKAGQSKLGRRRSGSK